MSRYQPYPEYKDSGVEWIGEVPAHWGAEKVGNLFAELNDRGGSKDQLLAVSQEHGVLPQAEYAATVDRRLSQSQSGDYSNYKSVEPRSFVYNKMRMWQGAIGLSRYSGCVSPAYVTFRALHPVDENFYFGVFRTGGFVSEVNRLSQGICDDQNSCSFSDFRTIFVPSPPHREQSQIATFLDRETTRIDTLIEKKQRFIELLEEKRQAVITHAVTKGLDPNVPMKDSGVEWIGEVPAHWEKCQLKNLAAVCNGRDYKTVEDPDGQYPVIGSGGQFAWASECLYDGESVLFGRKGTIDKPLYINGPFWTVDTMFYTLLSKRAIGKYVYYVATIIPYDSLSTNTALPSMTQEDLSSLNLTVPDTAEQSQIATFLDRETTRIDTLIEKTRQSIELLKERRSALITAAVTGKIDVREEAA